MSGLIAQSAFVEGIAENSDGEDGDGEDVAAVVGVAAREFGEGFVAVFVAGCEVPEGGVEDYAAGGDYKGGEREC